LKVIVEEDEDVYRDTSFKKNRAQSAPERESVFGNYADK
jgi:hypothetical protein